MPSSTDRSLPRARFGVAEHFRPGEQDRVERVVPRGVSLDDAGRLDGLFGDGHAALFDALGLHIPAVGVGLTAERAHASYLDHFDHFEHFSDVPLDRSKPLHALECANPNQGAFS